jgi:hypothetical protein
VKRSTPRRRKTQVPRRILAAWHKWREVWGGSMWGRHRLIALSMSLGCRAPVHLYSVILRTMTSASQDVGLWRERVAQEQAAALRASPLDPRHLRTTRECRLRMEIELALRADPRLRRPSQQSPRKGPPQLAPRSSHRTKPDAPSPRVSSTPRNLGVQVCDSS